MPTEDKMTIDERLKYLRIQQTRYRQANRKERTRLLDEMERVTCLDLKTVIRHMGRKRNDLVRKPHRKQRGCRNLRHMCWTAGTSLNRGQLNAAGGLRPVCSTA